MKKEIKLSKEFMEHCKKLKEAVKEINRLRRYDPDYIPGYIEDSDYSNPYEETSIGS